MIETKHIEYEKRNGKQIVIYEETLVFKTVAEAKEYVKNERTELRKFARFAHQETYRDMTNGDFVEAVEYDLGYRDEWRIQLGKW